MTENQPADVFTTHGVSLDGARAVKTFRSWDRGEHLREWRGLNLLHRYAPGLGPEPISGELDREPPRIVMSRVPGKPLATQRATSQQVDALAAALDRMHRCVPPDILATAEPQDTPADMAQLLRKMRATRARPSDDASDAVHAAFDAVAAFIDSDWPTRAALIGEPSPVFGLCDGNLANYLWDGHEIRIIDFESAGRNDRAYDVADVVEHISTRLGAAIAPEDLIGRLRLRPDEHERARAYRPAFAAFWFLMLLPDGPAHRRNPPGSLEDQAAHLQSLL
ncbi:aminoglycoside phosphotransferase family protein [Actinospica robiniae]|uniref:aminoglycoside phosphotransferase family protein n=1 Tax=Actinospica robiniae TaxID=304901 RepID=UPI000403204C|nr:aminoglycoside phosphotransferase family protein [Actinospica robiniae]